MCESVLGRGDEGGPSVSENVAVSENELVFHAVSVHTKAKRLNKPTT